MSGFLTRLFPPKPDRQDKQKPTTREARASIGAAKVEKLEAHVDTTSVLRQNLTIDRWQNIFGYQFSFLSSASGDGAEDLINRDELLIKALGLMRQSNMFGNRLVFLRVSKDYLESARLGELPVNNLVVMIEAGADGVIGDEMIARIGALREFGFRIGYRIPPGTTTAALPRVFDFIQISAPAYDGFEISALAKELRRLKMDAAPLFLIAGDIETAEDFQFCLNAGCDCFHGPFLKKRDATRPRSSNVDRSLIISILNKLRSDAENGDIARVINQDPVVTYRLLRYINSAANGLANEVASIEQCLIILGRERLYRWISLLLFDLKETGYYERVMIEQALIRANLMERFGTHIKPVAPNPDQLFLVGLFSMLEAILGQPLAEILADIRLPEAVKDALLEGTGPLAPCLKLVIACEAGVPEDLLGEGSLGPINQTTINEKLLQALAWAGQVSELNR